MQTATLTPLFDRPVPERTDAQSLLAWATEQFEGSIALSSSLGPQTLVVIDVLHQMGLRVPVFAIDTGLLFPETYALWRQIEARYDLRIESVRSSLTVEDQAVRDGARLWETDPNRCCDLRKVLPLRSRLDGQGAWITGLRRDPNSATRSHVEGVEWDAVNGLFKVNPLWSWSRDDVLAYAAANDVPLNPLLNQGFRTLGCTHCTVRAEGDHARSGRWKGTEKTECGLHWPTLLRNTP